jgi:hypothetical protein
MIGRDVVLETELVKQALLHHEAHPIVARSSSEKASIRELRLAASHEER